MENGVKLNFNIMSHPQPTNQDLSVIFTPDSSVVQYKYEVIKDGVVIKSNLIKSKQPTTFLLEESGQYQIKIENYHNDHQKTKIESGTYYIDKEAPVIELGSNVLTMKIGDALYPMGDVKAYDQQDGDLLDKVTTNVSELNLEEIGTKQLVYSVSDQAGNVATKTMVINVVKNDTLGLLFIQSGIILSLVIILTFVLSYRKSVKLEKRIRKYSVEPIYDNSTSLFDEYHSLYEKILKRISKLLQHSVFLKKYSKHYEKYVGVIAKDTREGMDFVSVKILIALIFVLIATISFTIQLKLISIYEIVLPFIVGFFVPDLLYFSKYRIHRKQIENDLLQAIIIMNNAFKSGRSITQAIELVMTELDGAVSKEFKKMRMELSFGLSIDVVFERFSSRIQIEEVNYLTASLSILNKTGGNIIKVFSSIEQSLFNKKKLRLELDSLTSSSKMIMYVLFCVPILFIIFVTILNPTYFLPFFTTPIGIVLLLFIIIYYIIYIICVKKIMKVRM